MTAAITIHYKDATITHNCIKSLLKDGWDPVLVWDNSDDEGVSLQLLQCDLASMANVLWRRSPVNLGFGKGMNYALAALSEHGYRGPVLLINNDVHVREGMRIALHTELQRPDPPAIVAPRILQDGREHGWLYYQPWLALVTNKPLPGSFAYISGCCLLINQPPDDSILFDEAFFMYGEDVELSWRVRRQGGKLLLLDRPWIDHIGSASTGQASELYERFLVESHLLLAKKLTPNLLLRRLKKPLQVISLFARATVRSARFQSLVPLKAFIGLDRLLRLKTLGKRLY